MFWLLIANQNDLVERKNWSQELEGKISNFVDLEITDAIFSNLDFLTNLVTAIAFCPLFVNNIVISHLLDFFKFLYIFFIHSLQQDPIYVDAQRKFVSKVSLLHELLLGLYDERMLQVVPLKPQITHLYGVFLCDFNKLLVLPEVLGVAILKFF